MQGSKSLESPQSAPESLDLEKRIVDIESQLKAAADPNALCLCVFSGDLDKLLAALVIATGAAACGMSASIFFTFWGTAALKKRGPQSTGKSLIEKMFGWMLPGGLHKRKLSKLDMGGFGRQLMMREMKKKKIADLPTMFDMARDLEVQLYICDMSMTIMGIRQEELIDYPNMQPCGSAHFAQMASTANTTLFI